MKAIKHNLGRKYYADGATPEHLDGIVSKSMLWQFIKSPYKWRAGVEVDSSNMAFGRLVHCLCLTPQDFDRDYATVPADAPKDLRNDGRVMNAKKPSQASLDAIDWWNDFDNANQGKDVVKHRDIDKAKEMAAVVMESPEIYALGERDYEIAVYDEVQGTQVKGMIDIAPKFGDALVDIKTIGSIENINSLQSTAYKFGYHVQAALYLDLWNSVTMENRTKFMFAFIEKEAPYETAFVTMSGKFIELGRAAHMNAIAKWNECLRNNHFPRTIEGVQELEPPAYAFK